MPHQSNHAKPLDLMAFIAILVSGLLLILVGNDPTETLSVFAAGTMGLFTAWAAAQQRPNRPGDEERFGGGLSK